jgi:hypothetical protein
MRTFILVCLGAMLAACGSDNPARQDKGVTADERPVSVDKSPTTDKPISVDTAVVQDLGPKPDQRQPKITGPAHTGWKATTCVATGCHPTKVSGHTATQPPECAKCHGGNGACNPDGKNSGKQNHNSSSTCTMSKCHDGGKHGYTSAPDCAACHFSASGVVDC